jgi:hypothetical protein
MNDVMLKNLKTSAGNNLADVYIKILIKFLKQQGTVPLYSYPLEHF